MLGGLDFRSLHRLAGYAGASLIGFLQAGLGAIARTLQDKAREIEVSLQDFGGVADGAFVAGGAASGTDNLVAWNKADTYLNGRGGGVLKVPAGQYYFSAKPNRSRGVRIKGEGRAHLPVYIGGGFARGSILLINGAVGDDCMTEPLNTGHAGIEEISIYNTNTNAIRSVLNVSNVLHPDLKNVEPCSLRKAGAGSAGLLIGAQSAAPNYDTLYGHFENVVVNITDINTANEASVSYGLKIQSLGTTRRPNANVFIGGDFQGRLKSLQMDGDVANSGALNCVFLGTRFDAVYNTDMEHEYVANAEKVVGYGTVEHVYVVKFVDIIKAHSPAFVGCYFEIGGVPATYDDTVNGVEPLLGVVYLDDPTEVTKAGFLECNWTGYLYDNGGQTKCDPTTSGNIYNARPIPKLTVRKSGAQTIPNGALTDVEFGSVLEGDDAQLEFTSPTATIKEAGTYLISWKVTMAGWATAGTYGFTRLVTTPASFDGGHFHNQGAAVPISSEGCAAVTLARGETVKLQVIHVEGNNQDTTADAVDNFLSIAKL